MKLDFTKEYKEYYKAGKTPALASHQGGKYVTIEGQGEPAGAEFIEKVSALYPVAYGVKKIFKKAGEDFGVAKLEGLWWVEGGADARKVPKSQWHWKLLIRMPESLTADQLEEAKAEVIAKKKLALASAVSLESMKNGRCVEMMHLGPYADEETTIDSIAEFMKSNGLKKSGLHHEIYLSDPNKSAPEKMKTIIRQPVK